MATTKWFFITWFSSSTYLKVFQIWKTSRLEDFQTISRKSSRRLPGSLLTESSLMSPFHNRFERLVFNQMVLIFHLDMYFVCSIKVFQIWTTSKKSSRRLPRSLPDDFQEVFQTTSKTTSMKSSDRVFFKWSLSLSL
ncbi:hypothetical protein F2Q69_00047376 [Brassica cretica]|uniref:Uncharacterized protein n=1 Tax=Brassica cretica TaxID=69181 RepID=A0A8S9PRR0_BRACR|nr:hypothetical protein F2Q69_00047376 [Brassica cretica]